MKKFVALARVSSREQEREGFSLAVQEEALRRYAGQNRGEIIRFFRIAETASKSDERKTFRELIRYAKQNAWHLDALLFYKVDRAARNLFDYVELERLESKYDLPFVSVTQPTDSNPAGRMMRRTLANMASFYTEQQSVDIREGLARRVQEGWFVGRPPYGYINVRKNGRSLIEIDPVTGPKVQRAYQLFAYEGCTMEGIIERLAAEGVTYQDSQPKFPRSSLYTILRDRSYIGEIEFRGNWHSGKHEPLIDRSTWDRAQALFGCHRARAHESTYAGEFMTCQHCGHMITGERKIKRTKQGERAYTYYRCTRYNTAGHPRSRVTESTLDRQMLAIFDKMRIEDEQVREWFRAVLRAQTRDVQAEQAAQRSELIRQQTLLMKQQAKLLDLRLQDDVDQELYARKQTELRDRLASISLQLEVVDRSREENADLAVKVFELSQTLREQWLTADYAAKRRILEIVCLNCQLNDATLVPTMRKPFDVLAEGLSVSSSGGGGN